MSSQLSVIAKAKDAFGCACFNLDYKKKQTTKLLDNRHFISTGWKDEEWAKEELKILVWVWIEGREEKELFLKGTGGIYTAECQFILDLCVKAFVTACTGAKAK